MALSKAIREQLDLVIPNTKKNLTYIKKNDWAAVSDNKYRKQIYDRCHLITELAITSAKKIYNLAINDLNDVLIKKHFDLFVEFYTIQEGRYYKLQDEKDWTTWSQGTIAEEILINLEIEFQTKVLKDLSAQKEALRSINFGGTDEEAGVPIRGHDKIPLAMARKIEEKYPLIKKMIEEKEDTYEQNI